MSRQQIRLFIAFPLPAAVTAALAETAVRLAGQLPPRSVRWVSADHMHLTLRFLGDTDPERLPPLRQAIDDLAAGMIAHRPVLGSLGCFPAPRRPRVLWAGLDGEQEPLRRLHAALSDSLVPLGWPRDPRPYAPHITLGRVRRGQQIHFPDAPPQPPALPVDLARLQLYQSHLGPGGPRYQVLHGAGLRSAG